MPNLLRDYSGLYIDGKWISTESVQPVFNPATEDVIARSIWRRSNYRASYCGGPDGLRQGSVAANAARRAQHGVDAVS
jgi:hypothetical protein